MKIETETYTLPAHWACALIYGDYSGLEDADQEELDRWLEAEQPGYCIDCAEEPYFATSNDAGTLAGDVIEYTFHVIDDRERERD